MAFPTTFRSTRFQSTLPARGATAVFRAFHAVPLISIHAPRTGSDLQRLGQLNRPTISIHAPRTGSDKRCWKDCCSPANFNPRSPHGERRPRPDRRTAPCHHFNPRSPHGERHAALPGRCLSRYFNPRSPHGERHDAEFRRQGSGRISIHAPRTGSDDLARGVYVQHVTFQSTLPARGATASASAFAAATAAFQSTLPARGATRRVMSVPASTRFQSTLPARGATDCPCHRVAAVLISIHAPRTGSDQIVLP